MNISNLISSFKIQQNPPQEVVRQCIHRPNELKEKAVELRLSGLRFVDIADQLGASKSAVRSWCTKRIDKDLSVKLSSVTQKLTMQRRIQKKIERQDRLKELLLEHKGLSNRAMAKILGVVNTTINSDMREIRSEKLQANC